MSVYSDKKKGWRFDFVLKGIRYTSPWYGTKGQASKAEAKQREEALNPAQENPSTGTAFLEMVNLRLDHVKAYNCPRHYQEYLYIAKRWGRAWGDFEADEIDRDMVEDYLLNRLSAVSASAANKDLRSLRATFNFAKKRSIIKVNPTDGIDFFPAEKSIRYVPNSEDLDKVIAVASPDDQDYLWTLRDTMARVSEINGLIWEDVDLEKRFLVLYTRKKKGGHRTPRKVPLTSRLYVIMARRKVLRDQSVPWVFWHTYREKKSGEIIKGPFLDRKRIMQGLCKKAGVPYFRFHAFRHSGASLMEGNNVPVSSIQRILGHENRLTTEIYLHSLGQSERDAMDVFEAAANHKG
ncbi:MAG: site-specific integrase [Deltaproteobacteria bacterium]|nr:site-specific integrase [Deltaproteobacteria bacterium]